jgi:hypothetical protein
MDYKKITHLGDALAPLHFYKGESSCLSYMREVARAGEADSATWGRVNEDMSRSTGARIPIWRMLLAFVVLALALAGVLLALWSGPDDAATTFTVNKTGDAKDSKISDARVASSTHNPRACVEKPPALAGEVVAICT